MSTRARAEAAKLHHPLRHKSGIVMRLRRTCEENSAPQMYTILSSSLLLALFLFLPFFFALVLVRGVGAARMRSERGQMMRATLPGNSNEEAPHTLKKADLLIEIKKQRELVEKAKAAPTAKDGLMAAYFGGKKK